MAIGPIQLALVAFENDDNFNGQIAAALREVRGRGAVKLLDLLFVHKTDSGDLEVIEDRELTAGDDAAYGRALRVLFERAAGDTGPAAGDGVYGMDSDGLRAAVGELPNGTAAALMLFEHVWAAGLSAAVRSAGGRLVGQGILTQDALMVMGAEIAAIRNAEVAIEAAEAIKGAAVLDALAFADAVEEAEAELIDGAAAGLTAAVAARTVRALVGAGVIDDSELEPALAALIDAGLVDAVAIEAALAAAEAEGAAVAELAEAQLAR